MSRLKAALVREYEADPTHNIEIHNPRNTVGFYTQHKRLIILVIR